MKNKRNVEGKERHLWVENKAGSREHGLEALYHHRHEDHGSWKCKPTVVDQKARMYAPETRIKHCAVNR